MDWTMFNWVDWVFAAVLLYGAVAGLARGLSRELATLIALAAAAIVIRLFYEPVSAWVCARWGWNPEITRLAAVVVLGLGTLYGMRLLRIALGALMTFSFKGAVERVGGLLTGVVRQGATFLLLLLAASFVPFSWLQRAVMYDSATGRVALPVLVDGYNALAAKAALIQAEVPAGIVLPHAVMPPLPPEADGIIESEPMFPTEEE